MNITESETPYLIEAKTCGCIESGKSVSYSVVESIHSLCLGKGELILAQIQACQRLLKYAKDEDEKNTLINEITKLNLVLDMIRY